MVKPDCDEVVDLSDAHTTEYLVGAMVRLIHQLLDLSEKPEGTYHDDLRVIVLKVKAAALVATVSMDERLKEIKVKEDQGQEQE